MSEGEFKNWLGSKLRHFLGFDDVRQIVEYVSSITSAKELEDYLKVRDAIFRD